MILYHDVRWQSVRRHADVVDKLLRNGLQILSVHPDVYIRSSLRRIDFDGLFLTMVYKRGDDGLDEPA